MSDPIEGDDDEIPGHDTDDDQDGRSAYACLGCGDSLPRGRGGHCDACVEWGNGPGRALVNWNSGPCLNCGGAHHIQRCQEVLDALFAPAPRVLVPTIRTTAREWLDEDLRQDAIARAWSAKLLAERAA